MVEPAALLIVAGWLEEVVDESRAAAAALLPELPELTMRVPVMVLLLLSPAGELAELPGLTTPPCRQGTQA